MLLVLLSVCVLTLSSLIYFAEKGSTTNWSFFKSFWVTLMWITTVGSGETVPDTVIGRVLGGLTSLIGIFILALPVPLILNSFTANYRNRLWKHEVMLKKAERSEEETGRTKKESGLVTVSSQEPLVTEVGGEEGGNGEAAGAELRSRPCAIL